MSVSAIVILSGLTGGACWAGITLSATWWFNRRVRREQQFDRVPTWLP